MSEKGKMIFGKYGQLIFALVIIIMVIIVDIISENYSSRMIEKVDRNIQKINDILKKDQNQFTIAETDELERIIKQTIEKWEKKAGILTCFIEHEEIEKINVKLHLLEVELKNHLWGDAKRTLSETKQLVKYLNGKYKLSLQNIF